MYDQCHHFTAHRITNGTPVNSICLEEFTFLTSSNNIFCGFISTVKIIRRGVKGFPPVKKTAATSTLLECNVHKKKNRVYPKSVYQATVTGR